MASLYETDLAIFRAIHLGIQSSFSDGVFLALSYLGLGQVQAIITLAVGFKIKRLVWPLLISIGVTGLGLAQLLKALIPRERPSMMAWVHPAEGHRFSSFPSGHTTTSFAVAMTLLLFAESKEQKLAGYICLALAVGIGVSRIYRGVHWPTDVFAGACAGTLVSCLLYALWPKQTSA